MSILAEVDEEIQDDLRGNLDLQARLLYGLIHARWIVTARGLAKMVRHPTHPRPSSRACPSLYPDSSHYSSRSTNAQILVDALACCANRSLSSLLGSQMCHTRSLSSSTAAAAKISILPSHPATARSTARTSGPPSLTSSFSSTPTSSHLRADPSNLG